MKTSIRSLCSLFILFPTIAMADYFEGFFLSVEGGITQAQARIKHTVDFSVLNNNFTATNVQINTGNPTKQSDVGLLGGLSLGYSWLLHEWILLGIEGRGYLSNTAIHHDQQIIVDFNRERSDFHVKIKMQQQYALLAKLGWLMCPQTQIYGLLGPQWGHIQFNSDGAFRSVQNSIPNENITLEKSIYKRGILLGLGIEHAVSCNSSVALEYNFAHYGDIHAPHTALGRNIDERNQAKMITSTTLLKYTYYFCG